LKRCSGEIISMVTSSVGDQEFDHRSSLTKGYTTGISASLLCMQH